MLWTLSFRACPQARAIADRHYNRQSPGAQQFVPPGRCLVLLTKARDALWITSWPEFAQHRWQGAWMNSCFRNEATAGGILSSALILDAIAVTRWKFGSPPPAGHGHLHRRQPGPQEARPRPLLPARRLHR